VTDNLAIWNALGKTDPSATKPFKRGGGFSGTAVKPMWIIKRLTEQFGPAGLGWGVNEPRFQVVEAAGDTLVYCTVSAWHGKPENVLWGVGGDKVAGKNKNGPFSDDEAFKKAFTDAVNNAFKSIGVAADIHMGLFDDDKYVAQVRGEFEDKPEPPALINDSQYAELIALAQAADVQVDTICKAAKVDTLQDLPASEYQPVRKKLNLTIDAKIDKPRIAA
jgi:hypothetical protein